MLILSRVEVYRAEVYKIGQKHPADIHQCFLTGDLQGIRLVERMPTPKISARESDRFALFPPYLSHVWARFGSFSVDYRLKINFSPQNLLAFLIFYMCDATNLLRCTKSLITGLYLKIAYFNLLY